MALATDSKTQTITKFRVHNTDTGSPEVQVAILSQRLLKYLKSRNPERYKNLIQSLGIRR
jgi:small subunit ribosomal protein S15